MAFWDIDLTTRDGARKAASQGGIACYITCGLTFLGGVMIVTPLAMQGELPRIVGAAIGVFAEFAITLIAGLRLRQGAGAIWGCVAAFMLAGEIALKAVNLNPFMGIGIAINLVIIVMMINGIRGAFALKRSVGFEDADVEVFN